MKLTKFKTQELQAEAFDSAFVRAFGRLPDRLLFRLDGGWAVGLSLNK